MDSDVFTHRTAYIWQLRTSDLYKDQRASIEWLQALAPAIGTKHQRSYLLKSMKQLLNAMVCHPTRKWRTSLAHGTVQGWYKSIVTLVRWMTENDIWLFSGLDADDLLAFLQTRRARHGEGVPAAKSLATFTRLLADMWDLRSEYVGALRIDVRSLEDEIARVCEVRPPRPWEPIDEAAALPLVFDAVQWIEQYGDYFVNLAATIHTRQKKELVGLDFNKRKKRLAAMYREVCGTETFGEIANKLGAARRDAWTLCRAFSATQGAALIVLLFVVGFRVSEAVRLDEGCIELREDEYGQMISYLRGVAAKKGGKAREWVAGYPIPTVVKCMEELFRPVREEKNFGALFLARTNSAPVPLPGRRVARMRAVTPVTLMRTFANAGFRSDRPQIKNLHPHAARKTFARFVVRRDKRALEALSLHFGHAYRDFTDGAYIGSDIELERLLAEEDREELGRALAVLLEARNLAGKGKEAILEFKKNKVRFRGKIALRSTVEDLIKKGAHIAPCDWGYCLYTQALSACGGDRRRPNEVNRSPEVCGDCKNFAVTQEHVVWWNARVTREEAFLKEPNIPEQARLVTERRLKQSKRILAELVLERAPKKPRA